MTEFWVSQAKHYCKICKIWVSGHAQNIKRHELTDIHLMKAREQLKQMRKNDMDQEIAAANEIKELRRMEKAAKQSDDSLWFGQSSKASSGDSGPTGIQVRDQVGPQVEPHPTPMSESGEDLVIGLGGSERSDIVEKKVKKSKVIRAPPLAGDGWELRGDVFDGCPINKQQRICARIAAAMGQRQPSSFPPVPLPPPPSPPAALPPDAAAALAAANAAAVAIREKVGADSAACHSSFTSGNSSIVKSRSSSSSSTDVEGSIVSSGIATLETDSTVKSSQNFSRGTSDNCSTVAGEGTRKPHNGASGSNSRGGAKTIGEWHEVVDPRQSAFGDVVKAIREEGDKRATIQLPGCEDGGSLSIVALEMLADTERRPILNATDLKAEAKPVYWDKPSMQSDTATVGFAKRTKPKPLAKRSTLRK
eukprot:GHVS01001918.1.p1 GENE.GHVS01001918.1~~GHVS01001918.1.p1  ORF type:complete len:420 (-),score=81.38 GHVS01001918.1:17-1276(-)